MLLQTDLFQFPPEWKDALDKIGMETLVADYKN
jgi:hypothetical protein